VQPARRVAELPVAEGESGVEGVGDPARRPVELRAEGAARIVGRLTFNGTIIETGTDSYRLASSRARAEEPAQAG